ncbi:ABC transporter ATP-binding protein [Ponticaulis sp.]|uniref:ABC transporter ATP-binding protein n=1 Tax=Ponticaulis sp. TaxID=2020902 RepID=UPI000C6B773F|nr:ATP-binding cassette domain-containing protein [Ponticaulis sp.]MBN05064.1 ABC transporter ATP-binding protein [Ponticaulis sp.]|tara:strand:- start:304 stop:1263 length:960 start_codon:yes stop_codon:yes gene_type:complete
MAAPPLRFEGVTKRFGDFDAVKDVSFQLGAGEVIGFLGPNGAGKSTSLRMALGIMSPDEGAAELFGGPPTLSNLRRVGFLPEERGLYKKMSARNVIAYFGQLKGMKRSDALSRADELLESFGLGEFRKTRISRLSKGMAQKVQILSTFVHSPEFLILDEPFSGLDPVNQADLERLIADQNAKGTTILFSTHVMEHAERLCDRLVLIACGRKMFDGTLKEAFATQAHQVRLATVADRDLSADFVDTPFDTRALPPVEGEDDRIWWEISLPQGATSQDVLKRAIDRGIAIEGFEPAEPRLRDVFVSLVSEADEKYGALRHG